MEFFSSLFFFFLLFLSSILVLLLLLLLLLFSSDQNPSKTYPLIGHLPQFVKNRHRLLEWTTELLAASPTNTIIFRRLGGVRGIITANPSNIEYVLKTHFDNYPKGPRFISLLEDFLGQGIFNSDGDLWKAQRKTASFEFNTRSLRNFVVDNVRHETLSRLLPLLKKAAKTGDVVDLQDLLERFAFDNVCRVAFNEDPACLAEEDEAQVGGNEKHSSGFALAFKDAANLSAGRFRYAIPQLWRIKRLLGMGSERRLRESTKTVHDFATEIIRSRKKEKESSVSGSPSLPVHDDLLSRFVANDDNSEEFLRDIVISFILAGRETTSSSLAWFFWLLSSRPDVEQRIKEELKWVRARSQATSKDVAFSFDELREMNYLHAAISEALRLYPPVSFNSMACLADDVLPDGTVIEKGWFMSYNSYAMGRMEGVWGKDCCEYRPERWLEDGVFKPESPFKFLAFHAGPRMCLGKEMAYIQMKSIAACVLEHFEIGVVEKGKHPEMMLSLTLRMKQGLPVHVRERSAAAGTI